MANSVQNLPVFNGRKISTLLQNGEWYVAIKPICEGLEVQYNRAFQNLKDDEILGQLLAEQLMVAADGKPRKMTCLPERYVYGWLFSIRSDSPKLIEYKRHCYDLLYNHFHGALTGRPQLLTERSAIEAELITLGERLAENPDDLRLEELRDKKATIARELTKQVKNFDNVYTQQGSLFPAS